MVANILKGHGTKEKNIGVVMLILDVYLKGTILHSLAYETVQLPVKIHKIFLLQRFFLPFYLK